MNKAWDVFGSIIAWILSVALVILLIVTPILFSALSLMDTKTITKVVSELFTTEQTPSQPKEEPRLEGGIRAVTLSGVTKTSDSAENVAKGVLSDLFGESLTPEQINQILSSDAAKKLIDAYTEDLTDALTGNDGQMNFTEDKIKAVVDEHIDDIVDVVRKVDPKFADMTDEEIKAEILDIVDENAGKIVEMLPDPAELKDKLTGNAPALETLIKLLAMKSKIKLLVIGAIVLLSVLIFLCRLPRISGMCWVSVDLLTAGGINGCITACLLLSASAISQVSAQFGAQAAGVAGSVLGVLTNGMLIRTVAMLLCGGALLAAYIVLKKLQNKKRAAAYEEI